MDGVWCVVGWEMVGRLLDCWKLGWGNLDSGLSDASNTLCLGGITKAWVAGNGLAVCVLLKMLLDFTNLMTSRNIVVVLLADKKEERV